MDVTFKVGRINPMNPPRQSANGKSVTLAAVELDIVEKASGDSVVYLRDLWLTQNENGSTGEKFLTLRTREYEDTRENARLNPKTNKPYNRVPYTIFASRFDNGVGFLPNSKSEAYKTLCNTLFNKVVEMNGGAVPEPKTASSKPSAPAKEEATVASSSSGFEDLM